jgi:hypothetical protein
MHSGEKWFKIEQWQNQGVVGWAAATPEKMRNYCNTLGMLKKLNYYVLIYIFICPQYITNDARSPVVPNIRLCLLYCNGC